jgi:hypothetical protein
VPAGNASIAARNTAGCAEVSSEKRTPSPVIVWSSATHLVAAGVIDGVRRTELGRKPFCEWP